MKFLHLRETSLSVLALILALLITVAVGHGKGWSRGCRGWGNCHRGPTCADPTQIPNSEATAGTLGASCSSSAFSYYYRSRGTCSEGLQCCINNQGATLCERKAGACRDPDQALGAEAEERTETGACSAYPAGLPHYLVDQPPWLGICDIGLQCCRNDDQIKLCELIPAPEPET